MRNLVFKYEFPYLKKVKLDIYLNSTVISLQFHYALSKEDLSAKNVTRHDKGRTGIRIYGIIILLPVLFLLPMSHACAGITMAVGGWPPYTSKIDPAGMISAFLVTKIYKEVRIKVSFRYFPWKRSSA